MFKEKLLILITVFVVILFSALNVAGEELKILKALSSSIQDNNSELRAENAIDMSLRTRWSSNFSDPQWIYFDLGTKKSFNLIVIIWETAYGKVYEIQISDDALKWRSIFKEDNGNVEEDIIPVGQQKARYVRMHGIERGTEWGYSIHEFKIIKCALPEQDAPFLNSDLPIDERVNDLLPRMTLEEKIEQLSGIPNYDGMTSHSNYRLRIPSLRCADGPHGVHRGNATAFPVSIAIASTWEPDLMERIGIAIGKEMRAKSRNHSLGPCLNICRDPRGGRTNEGYGEDPYLTSKIAVAAIKGIQSQKVIATPKHFTCNNREKGRSGGPVEIDERTLREIYLPAFKACIKEGNAWSIMAAYNRVNGSYCCENKHLLRDILKEEWGFKGFVVSDWWACRSTVESAGAGLDLEMPQTKYYGITLLKAVKEGLVSEETVDDSVKRILRAKFWAGLFDERARIDPDVVECKEHIDLALETARKSIVLLKNENGLLPLNKDKIKSIAVLGPSADMTTTGVDLGSSQVHSSYAITPLKGIKNKVGNKIKIIDDPEKADVAIVFAGLTTGIADRVEGEGTDRDYLHLPGNQDYLIKKIAQDNSNTIVVLIGGSAITMDEWIDNVPAIIEAWYPGQEGGTAIADILFGDYNPSGKLPITFPESMGQLPPFDWDYKGEYKMGVGYRYYDKQNITPLFPFGYGLSYTRFKYSELKIEPEISMDGNIDISVNITNIGKRKGDEVVQLYLQGAKSDMERPIKGLKGFKRITLKPGETTTVNLRLKAEDLMRYNKDMRPVMESGTYEVMIGSSSRDIRLTGSFKIKKPYAYDENHKIMRQLAFR